MNHLPYIIVISFLSKWYLEISFKLKALFISPKAKNNSFQVFPWCLNKYLMAAHIFYSINSLTNSYFRKFSLSLTLLSVYLFTFFLLVVCLNKSLHFLRLLNQVCSRIYFFLLSAYIDPINPKIINNAK